MDNFLQFGKVRIFVLVLLISCLVPQWLCDMSPKDPVVANQIQDKENQEVKVEIPDPVPAEHKAAIEQDSGAGSDLNQHIQGHVDTQGEQVRRMPGKVTVEALAAEFKSVVLLEDTEPIQKLEDIGDQPKDDAGQQSEGGGDQQTQDDLGQPKQETEDEISKATSGSTADEELKEEPLIDRPCFPEDQTAEEERMHSEVEVEEGVEGKKVNEKTVDEDEVAKEKEEKEKLEKEEVEAKVRDEEEEEENIPSFDEWKKKKMAEQEQGRKQVLVATSNQDRGMGPGGPGLPAQQRQFSLNQNSKNHASADCGAKIVASNPEAQGTSAILMQNRDVYMLNPCSAKIWLTVELCEPIQIKHIEIANFELFSSTPESFRVQTSDRYPTREWHVLGTFHARDVRTLQSFSIQDQQMFTKYLKVEMLSFFGSEHYCPISILRVFGTSMEEEIIEDSESQHGSNEADLEGDLLTGDDLVPGEGLRKTNIIAGAIANAVNNIVKHAAKVFTGSEESKKPTTCTDNITNKDLQELRPCFPEEDPNITSKTLPDEEGCIPEVTVIHGNNEEMSEPPQKQKTLQQILNDLCDPCTYCQKCDYSEYLPVCNYVKYMRGMYSVTCKDFIVKTPTPQKVKNVAEKKGEKKKQEDVKSVVEDECKDKSCAEGVLQGKDGEMKPPGVSADTDSVKDDIDVKQKAETSSVGVDEQDEGKSQDEKETAPKVKTELKGELDKTVKIPDSETGVQRKGDDLKDVLGEDKKEQVKTDTETPDLRVVQPDTKTPPSKTEPAEQTFTKSTEATEATEEKSADTKQEQAPKGDKPPPAQVVESEKRQVVDGTEPENGVKEAMNGDLGDVMAKSPSDIYAEKESVGEAGQQTEQPKGSVGGVPANKESIFMRLNNRIKNLEYNMSLSQQYLQELSQKYRKQMEDMQKNFDKTINKLSETSKEAEEKDQKQQVAIGNLENQLDRLTHLVGDVSKEMHVMQKQMVERHFFLMLVEVVFLSFLFLFCTARQHRVRPSSAADEPYVSVSTSSKTKRQIKRRNSSDGTVGHKKLEMNTVKRKHRDDEDVQITGDYSNLLIVEPTKPLRNVLHKNGEKESVKQQHHGSRKQKSRQKSRDRVGSASSLSHFAELRPHNNHVESRQSTKISSAGLLFDGKTDSKRSVNGNHSPEVLCNGKHIPKSKSIHYFSNVETLYEACGTASSGKGYTHMPPLSASKHKKSTHGKKVGHLV